MQKKYLMKIFLRVSLFLLLINSVTAQNSVSYDLEPGLDQIETKHLEAWSKVKKVEGYRIQIMALSGSNSKSIIEKMQVDFSASFPEIPAYVTYFEPSFRLRVGDFRNKLDAYRVYKMISIQFPGAYIIKDKIEYLPKY